MRSENGRGFSKMKREAQSTYALSDLRGMAKKGSKEAKKKQPHVVIVAVGGKGKMKER
jgi:hypothetical protein